MPANLENPSGATGLEKISFHSNPKEGQCQRMFKLPHNCTHLTGQQSNVQNSPSQPSTYVNCELPDVQAGFRKGRGTRDQVANIHWKIKTAREFQKTSTSALLTTSKPLTVQITANCGKFFKRGGIPDHLTCLLRNQYAGQEATVRTLTWSNRQVPNRDIRAVYCHPAYLAFMQSTSCEMPGSMKHKLESRLPREM